MEDGDILPEDLRLDKQRRDEISQGQRKQRKEEDIRRKIREHSPTVSRRIQNPEGFFSEDWDEDKQEEDLTDGVLQLSPRDLSDRRQSSLKSLCSTPRGQI